MTKKVIKKVTKKNNKIELKKVSGGGFIKRIAAKIGKWI